MEYELKMNELVWAKIKGYPWWPGVVRNQLYNIFLLFR